MCLEAPSGEDPGDQVTGGGDEDEPALMTEMAREETG
jgi:hypothetical protein